MLITRGHERTVREVCACMCVCVGPRREADDGNVNERNVDTRTPGVHVIEAEFMVI